MKATKMIIIAVVVLIVLGAVFLKYVKPKLDERKEARRLKEAGILADANLKTVSDSVSDSARVSEAMPAEKKQLAAGGFPVID